MRLKKACCYHPKSCQNNERWVSHRRLRRPGSRRSGVASRADERRPQRPRVGQRSSPSPRGRRRALWQRRARKPPRRPSGFRRACAVASRGSHIGSAAPPPQPRRSRRHRLRLQSHHWHGPRLASSRRAVPRRTGQRPSCRHRCAAAKRVRHSSAARRPAARAQRRPRGRGRRCRWPSATGRRSSTAGAARRRRLRRSGFRRRSEGVRRAGRFGTVAPHPAREGAARRVAPRRTRPPQGCRRKRAAGKAASSRGMAERRHHLPPRQRSH